MRTLIVAALFAIASPLTLAAANCPAHPKAEWLKPDDAKKQIEAQGYKIRTFKTSGNCYEIYGHDKAGKKAEVYFDAKTLAIVKQEIGD
ncbi:hypothetical protein SAMN02745857_01092 [Andreprevotia lacus DSM 23236]|jgi:hypothetical protein|uniref:PepSY domain-containing protein n=1 Tax=Andreprevotia lacus DSM 23236 TaxID=1121001 RepID=A0A1W1XBU6_9NEIS|nr:PepSY domain-containing protein [Andreprevotia lacus]SMC20981.1 hypothetical protein SAMN02745857_01092 [Andreprevotia lacus DSM 23236]